MEWEHAPFAVGADEVSADVTRRIDRFYARDIDPAVWSVIGPLVKEAIAAAAPTQPRRATTIGSRTALLLSWCFKRGMDLTPEVVFHPDTIDEFISTACGHFTKGTRSTYRSTLLQVGEAYVGAPLFAPRALPLPTSDPEAPYTADEISALWGWARGLPTVSMRDGAAVVLAFGLSTGIKAVELNAATAAWIEDTPAGLAVDIPGDRARRVPVRKRWEPTMRDALARAGSGLVFRPERDHVNDRHLSRFLERLPRGDVPKLSMQRLRVTWIVELLDERVPLQLVADAAGVQADLLGRYAPFTSAFTRCEADDLLRGGR